MTAELSPADAGIEAAKRDAAERRRNQALNTLADAYKDKLVEAIEGDERLMDIMMELISDFVNTELDVITDEDAKYDLAFLLLDRVALKTY